MKLVLFALFIASMAATPPESEAAVLKPGDMAPRVEVRDPKGEAALLGDKTTSHTLLLFVKPKDRYGPAAVRAFDDLAKGRPEFSSSLARFAIVSRLDDPSKLEIPDYIARSSWPVLFDPEDKAYHGFKIIATPTLVLLDPTGKVLEPFPGFDHGTAQRLRLAIAAALEIELTAAERGEVPKPNMLLQLGRRLADRGQPEKALEYYDKAADRDPLPPEALLEKAGLLGQMERWEDAAKAIEAARAAGADPAQTEEATRLLEESRKDKEGGLRGPPLINR